MDMWNNREIIKLAFISGNPGERKIIGEELSPFGFDFVYIGHSLAANLDWMKVKDPERKPELLIVSLDTPDLRTTDLKPNFPKVKKYLPQTTTVLKSDLGDMRVKSFVEEAKKYGVRAYDSNLDIPQVATLLRDIAEGTLEMDEIKRSENIELWHPTNPSKER